VSAPTSATPNLGTSHNKPPRYWKGYDAVFEDASAAEDFIDALDQADPRHAFNQFDAEVDNLWPLLWIIASRSSNEHFVCETRPASETQASELHCTCGLVVEATDLVDSPATLETFHSASGHIDWRMRGPEHYAADNEPGAEQ
jgi:hypothetical protein